MDNRMCRFACLVLSPLSFCLIARHVTSCKGTSEKNWMVGKLWLMVSAMVLFFCAQRYARQNMPQQKELENLAKGIETLLKLRGGDGS